jgi:ribonuclease T2
MFKKIFSLLLIIISTYSFAEARELNGEGVSSVSVAPPSFRESFNASQGYRSSRNAPRGVAGVFDYYLMSLSWSPSYCEDMGSERGDPQCQKTSTKRPYQFVLHGIWPQNEKGWPQFCGDGKPTSIAPSIYDKMLPIMPSNKLISWEWKKHGTCSGLSQEVYFDQAKKAFEQISIPEAFQNVTSDKTLDATLIKQNFIQSNQSLGLNESMLYVTCDRKKPQLREVWICLDKNSLKPRPCGSLSPNICQGQVRIPPAR